MTGPGAGPMASPEDLAEAHAVLRGGVLDFEATGVFSGLEVQAWPVIEAAIAAALARQRSRAEAAEARAEALIAQYNRSRDELGVHTAARFAAERRAEELVALHASAVAAAQNTEDHFHAEAEPLLGLLREAFEWVPHVGTGDLLDRIVAALASAPAPVPSTPATTCSACGTGAASLQCLRCTEDVIESAVLRSAEAAEQAAKYGACASCAIREEHKLPPHAALAGHSTSTPASAPEGGKP